MSVVEEINKLAERYTELVGAKGAVEELLYLIESIDLPSGIEGSHHAEMEWGDTLEQIENEMLEIQNRLG